MNTICFHRCGCRCPACHPNRRDAGITLPEMLVTLAVLATTALGAVTTLPELLERRRIESAAAQSAALLQSARLKAHSLGRSTRVSFHRDASGSCAVLHAGPAGACSCPPIGHPICSAPEQLHGLLQLPASAGVVLQANVASITFDPAFGTTSPTATVRLTGPRGLEIRQVVNLMGRVRTCTAGSPVAGWRTC